MNATDLIDALTGNRELTKPVGSCLGTDGQWYTVFVATDIVTHKPRRNERGQVIFNLKPQR